MTGANSDAETYHELSDGTKWPNCIQCYSENTSVVPATGEWTCQDCGTQWHSDETPVEDGDAPDIGGQIERMVRALADESPTELARMARDRGIDTEERQ